MKLTGNKDVPQAERQAAADAIDAAAERARQAFLTAGAGQMMVYQQKLDEARRFVAAWPAGSAAPQRDADNWPFLTAEVGLTGASASAVAQVILKQAQAWALIGALIEKRRLAAKAAVGKATSSAALAAARNVAWPAP